MTVFLELRRNFTILKLCSTEQMGEKTPAVAVVILNWKRPADTLEALNSVKQSRYPLSHIIVVDNASGDGSVERISKAYPGITLIANNLNLGFAGGNNAGISFAVDRGAEYVLILNNDAVVEPETMGEMIRCVCRDPRVAAVGAKIFRRDDPEILDFCFGTVRYNHWLVTQEGAGERDSQRFAKEQEVEWVSGCCMLMSGPALKKIGSFDEVFFAYLEDVDWCLRAREKNYRIMFCPAAKAFHKGSSSTGKNSPQINYFYGRNSILFLKRHGRFISWFKFLSAFYVAFVLRLIKRMFAGNVGAVLYSLIGSVDGFHGREPRYEQLGLRDR